MAYYLAVLILIRLTGGLMLERKGDQRMNFAQLTGQDDAALIQFDGYFLHPDAVDDWSSLQFNATQAGFDLAIASAYRSFSRQLLIWNEKATGIRPVYDGKGQPLPVDTLSPTDLVFAILRWSALPGGSRHHWGTDLDVYDRSAVADDYVVQLNDEEVQPGGVFAALHDWLDQRIENQQSFGFYRPYITTALSQSEKPMGIAAERWHLSHRPSARLFSQELTRDALYRVIESQPEMQLQSTVLAHLDEIFTRFINASAIG